MLTKTPNNNPATDFYCNSCQQDFELKSGRSSRAGLDMFNTSIAPPDRNNAQFIAPYW
ncbi:MAG: hypothetical protein H0V62_12270 [Gammaproteobacteria bacterium]|nr:hypothetical protein [Gammaproteobacteria bacterium]MBA3731482.1 hypothetical protein [Gammaproteobacteria bacterium]